jgi:hypothetical protein
MNKEQFLIMGVKSDIKVKLNQNGVFNLDEEYPQSHNEVCDITDILRSGDSFEYEISDSNISYGFIEINKFDLICRPLSDLTKDEWIDKLNTFACELLDAAHVYDEKNIVGINWMLQPFEIVMWLIKNHFNLMDESEPFIDVNTLEINPYK